jgi:hypothetical protein
LLLLARADARSAGFYVNLHFLFFLLLLLPVSTATAAPVNEAANTASPTPSATAAAGNRAAYLSLTSHDFAVTAMQK